ncbi:unnamed protein product [Porites lobata]|uniref:Uncharacterized protein n=1 Tax=Porites lobata TaxID=104759 RepID=A0ABN8SB68_9CNID|nr:unnamed protein product [Porites lobata]
MQFKYTSCALLVVLLCISFTSHLVRARSLKDLASISKEEDNDLESKDEIDSDSTDLTDDDSDEATDTAVDTDDADTEDSGSNIEATKRGKLAKNYYFEDEAASGSGGESGSGEEAAKPPPAEPLCKPPCVLRPGPEHWVPRPRYEPGPAIPLPS